MAITSIRKSVIDTINEVRRRLALNEVTSLTQDKLAIQMVDYLNDVVEYVADHGDWLELIQFSTVTAAVSVDTYSIPTSAVVKDVRDIYFNGSKAGLTFITFNQMRQNKIGANIVGQPYQYTFKNTDSNGNPVIWVYPTPDASNNGNLFDMAWFEKPPLYTTDDADIIIPFPSRTIVLGLETICLLEESNGSQSTHFDALYKVFGEDTEQAFARFKGNSGKDLTLRSFRSKPRRR